MNFESWHSAEGEHSCRTKLGDGAGAPALLARRQHRLRRYGRIGYAVVLEALQLELYDVRQVGEGVCGVSALCHFVSRCCAAQLSLPEQSAQAW